MGTELGGGGLVTPASLKIAQDGMRRVLAHIGLLQGQVPAPTPTRLTELGGDRSDFAARELADHVADREMLLAEVQ